MKRTVFVVLAVVALLMPSLVFAGGQGKARARRCQVGVILPTKDEERWTQDQTRFQDAFTKAGYNVQILFSEKDSAKEKANVESLISNGVKAIIICPVDGSAAAAAADEARKAGIKVISYDRLIRDTASVDYYVTFDSVAVGAAWAQYLVDRQGQRRQGASPVPLRRRRLRQQRVHLLPGRLGRAPAQDRRRHLRDRELQRSRRPPGQGHAHPRGNGEDHRPGDHQLVALRCEEHRRVQPDRGQGRDKGVCYVLSPNDQTAPRHR